MALPDLSILWNGSEYEADPAIFWPKGKKIEKFKIFWGNFPDPEVADLTLIRSSFFKTIDVDTLLTWQLNQDVYSMLKKMVMVGQTAIWLALPPSKGGSTPSSLCLLVSLEHHKKVDFSCIEKLITYLVLTFQLSVGQSPFWCQRVHCSPTSRQLHIASLIPLKLCTTLILFACPKCKLCALPTFLSPILTQSLEV